MIDAKGPYFHRCGTVGERCNCKACAYEEGFAAGRVSRDGLRAELDRLIYVICEKDIVLVAIVSMSVSFAITTSIFYVGMR